MSAEVHTESRLGAILVRTLSVPEQALERALEAQAAGDARDIGTILEEDDDLTREDLDAAVELQRRMRGDDLAGALADQVRRAYARARRTLEEG